MMNAYFHVGLTHFDVGEVHAGEVHLGDGDVLGEIGWRKRNLVVLLPRVSPC